jgi:uncharacterized glyoxalase superfamily protein PhnB
VTVSNDATWAAAPILGVGDVLETVAYFRDVLGFTSRPEGIYGGVGDEAAVYALVRREGVAVHIQIRRRPLHLDDREAHETDAYFTVPDVDALYREYLDRGVTMLRPLQNEPYGMRDFTIETPDGHRLAFASEAKT